MGGTLGFCGFTFKSGTGTAPPPPQQPWCLAMRLFDIPCSFVFPLKWKLQKVSASCACYDLPGEPPRPIRGVLGRLSYLWGVIISKTKPESSAAGMFSYDS